MTNPYTSLRAVPNEPGVWYHITYYECVLCGRCDVLRERRLGPKPTDWHEIHEHIEEACGGHFL